MKKLGIIILNYGGWADTVRALESLKTLNYPHYTAIVVDNGSPDSSVKKIKEWARGKLRPRDDHREYRPQWKPVFYAEYDRRTAEAGGLPEVEKKMDGLPSPRRLVIIETGENLGFSGGNNVGIRYGLRRGFEFLMILNPDTVIQPDSDMKGAVEYLSHHQEAGLVAPLVYDPHLNSPHSPYYYIPVEPSPFKEALAYLFPPLSRRIFYRKIKKPSLPLEITKFFGCCFLTPARLWKKIGLMDEGTFLYVEEAILAHRMKERGLKAILYPDLKILHLHRGNYKKNHLEIWMRSRLYYHKKYRKFNGFQRGLIKAAMNFYKFSLEVRHRWKR